MKHDETYLRHIFEAGKNILRFTKGFTTEDFLADDVVQNAVMRQIEIIGEAAGKLSLDFRNSHPQVPWLDIIGMRNKLIHEYFGVDIKLVWKTVQKNIPELIKTINEWFPLW